MSEKVGTDGEPDRGRLLGKRLTQEDGNEDDRHGKDFTLQKR
jgi:hypothetical protein